MRKCNKCKGRGFIEIGPGIRGIKECPICKGKGQVISNAKGAPKTEEK